MRLRKGQLAETQLLEAPAQLAPPTCSVGHRHSQSLWALFQAHRHFWDLSVFRVQQGGGDAKLGP